MSIQIYQIGFTRLRVRPTNLTELSLDISRQFRGEAVQSSRSSKTFYSVNAQLPEPMDASFSGTLISDEYGTVNEQFNQLLSYGGRAHVDVIAYVPDCRPVRWLTTTALITGIERNYDVDDASPFPEEAMAITIDAIFGSFWQPLNHYLWEIDYPSSEGDSFRTVLTPYKSFFPKKVDDRSTFSFRKKPYGDMFPLYNPYLWEDMFDADDALASYYTEAHDLVYRIRPARQLWSGSPASIYAFTNLQAGNSIILTVESESVPHSLVTNKSTIFVDNINLMLSPDEILPTDVLFVTDGALSPSFILREEQLLLMSSDSRYVPRWTYQTAYPGELVGLDNRMTVQASNEIQMAYLHMYRAL